MSHKIENMSRNKIIMLNNIIKELKYDVIIRNEEREFIITLLSDYGRVHLYYIDKEELLKERNLSIEKMYAEIPNPMDLIKHLQFNKVKSRL